MLPPPCANSGHSAPKLVGLKPGEVARNANGRVAIDQRAIFPAMYRSRISKDYTHALGLKDGS